MKDEGDMDISDEAWESLGDEAEALSARSGDRAVQDDSETLRGLLREALPWVEEARSHFSKHSHFKMDDWRIKVREVLGE